MWLQALAILTGNNSVAMHGQYLLEIAVYLYTWAIYTGNNRVAIGMVFINWK